MKSLSVVRSSGDDQQSRITDNFVDRVKSLPSDQQHRVRFDGVMDDIDQSGTGKCDEVWTVGSKSCKGMDLLICDGPILRWSIKRQSEIGEYKGVALPRKALSRTRPQFYYVTFRITVKKA